MVKKTKNPIIEIDDLMNIWKIVVKNWYVVLITIAFSYIASCIYTYKLNEVYAAQSQIILNNNETYDYQSQLYKGLGYYYNQDNSNQMRVISSNDLIGKTLSKLKFNISYYIKGRIKTTEVFDAMPFEVSVQLLNSSLYENDFRLKIINERNFELSYQKAEKIITQNGEFDKSLQANDFFITIKKNDLLNAETVKDLRQMDYVFKIHSMSTLLAKYKSALKIENIENTTIIQLELEDGIASRAVTFLDSLEKVYIDYTAQAKIQVNENTLDNIDKQLKEITAILNSIEDDLESYKAHKGVLNLPKQEEQYFNNLTQFDVQKRQYELYISSLESLQNYVVSIGNNKGEKLLPPSFYIEPGDDYLKTALGKLYSMQMTRNEDLFRATELNKGINELDQNTELLRKNVLTYIDNSKKGLTQKIDALNLQINEYTDIIKTIPKTQRDLLTIQRKLDVNEKIYAYLLEKRASTLIARAGILPETSIIETAHSIGIVRPDKKKIMNYFLLFGAMIAFVIIFFRITFFQKIQTIEELKKQTFLPVLGDVIKEGEKSDDMEYVVVDKDPKSKVTENFRIIRTNLTYMASEVDSKVILLTSFNPGEGKTFCSVNLAAIIAKASKKVLLIELDLHRPKVQIALKMTSALGISNILIGKASVEECILKTSIENLDAILSGPTPPNASEIILSKHLAEVFEYARKKYEYVIVDTAPLGLITDATIIMKYVDINLFVLNTKFANSKIIAFTEENVQANKLKNSGLILNGVKQKRGAYYNYGYGYYSGVKQENNDKNNA